MEAKELQNVLDRIDQLKVQKAKAEGAIESIETEWKENYGVSSVEEAEELLKQFETELDETQKVVDKKYTELKEMLNEFEPVE